VKLSHFAEKVAPRNTSDRWVGVLGSIPSRSNWVVVMLPLLTTSKSPLALIAAPAPPEPLPSINSALLTVFLLPMSQIPVAK
jgi:hypothetical protein